jgi:replication factor A1
MKIAEVKANDKNVNIEGTLKEVAPAREFERFGKSGKVANAILADDSGEIQLTLWNEQVDEAKEGSKVKVTNGFVNEWQGKLQVSGGKFGTVEFDQ